MLVEDVSLVRDCHSCSLERFGPTIFVTRSFFQRDDVCVYDHLHQRKFLVSVWCAGVTRLDIRTSTHEASARGNSTHVSTP